MNKKQTRVKLDRYYNNSFLIAIPLLLVCFVDLLLAFQPCGGSVSHPATWLDWKKGFSNFHKQCFKFSQLLVLKLKICFFLRRNFKEGKFLGMINTYLVWYRPESPCCPHTLPKIIHLPRYNMKFSGESEILYAE